MFLTVVLPMHLRGLFGSLTVPFGSFPTVAVAAYRRKVELWGWRADEQFRLTAFKR